MQTRLLILLAPFLYVAHILEEAPGYMSWVNSLVDRAFPDQGHFFAGNLPSMTLTAVIAMVAAITLNRVALMVMLAWLSYFMFANAIFHIVATVVLRRYSPGTITAAALYLPYFAWFVRYMGTRVRAWVVAAMVLIFGMPMLIQGYMMVFRGTRFY